MTTWKDVMREVERGMKAAAREMERRESEGAVEDRKQAIESLLTVHIVASEPTDWQAMANQPEPQEPERSKQKELAAKHRLERYSPNLIDRVLGREEKRRKVLERRVEEARREDQRAFDEEHARYERAQEEWKSGSILARRILDGDPAACVEVMNRRDPIETVPQIESLDGFSMIGLGLASVTIRVRDEDAIPRERLKVLKSGKLSVTKMPKGQFYELHRI